MNKRELNDILNKIRLEYNITDLQRYKDDWKMCDEVCDQKELKIRRLEAEVKRKEFKIRELKKSQQEYSKDENNQLTKEN